MKKAAVYAGTENLYRDMITASKSLRLNSSVDEIYFLIKHKVFPYKVPDFIHTIDVSRQRYFGINCPNIYPHWTVMTLMKAILTKLFPDYDRILILDVDTIIGGTLVNKDRIEKVNRAAYWEDEDEKLVEKLWKQMQKRNQNGFSIL